MPCIREFKVLRVLNLQLSGHCGDHDPIDLTGISELFQLRYLKITSDVCIKLPNQMRKLQCLETLDIMDAPRVTAIPWDIIYLPHLLHLTLPVDTNLLEWIGSMTESANSLWGLGKLNYLQDLHLTICSSPPYGHLERNMEALGSLLGGHGNLKTIVLSHGSSVKNIVVPGASKIITYWDDLEPLPLLQRFECSPHSCIIFYQIPKWVTELGNLRILKIAVKGLEMICVGILRGLRALTDLSLYVETAPVNKIIFDKAGFSVLKYFKLRCRSGIPCLKFEADAMPNLWKLKLGFSAIPRMDQHDLIRIEHMPGLREISAKFGGGAADLEYASRTFSFNHPSNPTINMQLVGYSSYGDESTKHKQEPDEILQEKPDEYDKRLERAADKRISMSPESSSHLHVPEITPKLRQITSGGDEGRKHMLDKVLMPSDMEKRNMEKLNCGVILKQHAEKYWRSRQNYIVMTKGLSRFVKKHHVREAARRRLLIDSKSEQRREHMFEQVVTPSDVGELVVPKHFAERHFVPRLLGGAARAVAGGAVLRFEDGRGGRRPWRFRFSYRNSSQSYVMTKGWSAFVHDRSLAAGDTIFFSRAGVRLFIDSQRCSEISARAVMPPVPSIQSLLSDYSSLIRRHC